mgnify:CR=1 FL=1
MSSKIALNLNGTAIVCLFDSSHYIIIPEISISKPLYNVHFKMLYEQICVTCIFRLDIHEVETPNSDLIEI